MDMDGPWTDDELCKIEDHWTTQPKLSLGRLVARRQAGSG
jgi:hypothetical protein